MRVGLITGEFPPLQGGIGNYTDILSRHLHEQGHQVFVFSEARAEQQSDAIHLTPLRGKWGMNSIRQIQAWSSTYQLDVLNMQYQTAAFNMSPWIHFLPQLTKTPFVTTFHDLRVPYLFPKAGPLRAWIVNHLAHQSDAVIVSDPQDFARLQHLPLAHLIPIGSNIAATLPDDGQPSVRAEIGMSEDTALLGFFGFLNHSKGYDILLHALRGLLNRNRPVHLLQIGGKLGDADPSNMAYATEVDALIEAVGLSAFVHSTGFVDAEAVSRYLQACDLVVLPFRDGASQRRGSLMAAIANGCAIVTTMPLRANPYFTDEQLSLVPIDDANALVETIADLLNNPDAIEDLRHRVCDLQDHFDWSVITRQIALVYEQAIEIQS